MVKIEKLHKPQITNGKEDSCICWNCNLLNLGKQLNWIKELTMKMIYC